MNNYCFIVKFHTTKYREALSYSFLNLFHITFYMKKIKIDYSMFPVEKISEDEKNVNYKSMVSNDTFISLYKKKNHIEKINKTKLSFSYITVLTTEENDMAKNEIEMLPIIEKRIRSKIPFRFLYKKKLRDRLQRIIVSS